MSTDNLNKINTIEKKLNEIDIDQRDEPIQNYISGVSDYINEYQNQS